MRHDRLYEGRVLLEAPCPRRIEHDLHSCRSSAPQQPHRRLAPADRYVEALGTLGAGSSSRAGSATATGSRNLVGVCGRRADRARLLGRGARARRRGRGTRADVVHAVVPAHHGRGSTSSAATRPRRETCSRAQFDRRAARDSGRTSHAGLAAARRSPLRKPADAEVPRTGPSSALVLGIRRTR